VGIDAGTDHRAGEGAPTVNFYKPGEGKALHTKGCPVKPGMTENGVIPDPDRESIVLSWSMLGTPELLPAGHALGESVLLFQKIEDSVVDAQIARLAAIKAEREAAEAAKAAEEAAKKVEPQKPEVTFDQFGAMDIRTATVLAAERVPKTDKLLKLTIDTGIDTRTIVSGIAEYYSPEDMLGKQICILANLAPRTIRGIESKGMILMAKQGDGKMRFITPQEVVANGAQIG
jgi:methionyl-tRNA synthetase